MLSGLEVSEVSDLKSSIVVSEDSDLTDSVGFTPKMVGKGLTSDFSFFTLDPKFNASKVGKGLSFIKTDSCSVAAG